MMVSAICGGAGLCLWRRVEDGLDRWVSGAAGLIGLALIGLVIGLALHPSPAAAADGGAGTTVDLSPVLDAVIAAAVGVLTALAAWLARRVARWLGQSEDSEVRAYLETALVSAIDYAQDLALDAGRDLQAVETRSAVLADAAAYLAQHVPDALARFKLDAAGTERLLRSRLALATAGRPRPHPIGVTPCA